MIDRCITASFYYRAKSLKLLYVFVAFAVLPLFIAKLWANQLEVGLLWECFGITYIRLLIHVIIQFLGNVLAYFLWSLLSRAPGVRLLNQSTASLDTPNRLMNEIFWEVIDYQCKRILDQWNNGSQFFPIHRSVRILPVLMETWRLIWKRFTVSVRVLNIYFMIVLWLFCFKLKFRDGEYPRNAEGDPREREQAAGFFVVNWLFAVYYFLSLGL